MAARTVIVAPTCAVSAGVLDVLRDLAALGMVGDFTWVPVAGGVDVGAVPALAVTGRGATETTLQEALAAAHATRVRLAILVPDDARALDTVVEQNLLEMALRAAGGAPVEGLRLLIVRSAAQRPWDDVARDGWHNIVVSPEQSAGPARGVTTLSPTADPVDIARHATPTLAAVLGLWTGLETAPLDGASAPPAAHIRLARSFLRRVDATAVERDLRERVVDLSRGLPRPLDEGSRAVYLDDVPRATATMADALWRAHAGVLGTPVAVPPRPVPTRISFGAAVGMFFSFLWSAIRGAPAAWYRATVTRVSAGAAGLTQRAIFGSAPSAFTVVVNGRTADGSPASWSDVAGVAEALDEALAVQGDWPAPQETAPGLGGLWRDFVHGGLTLADGGRRSPALAPLRVDLGTGMLRRTADVVPPPSARFAGVDGVLAARVPGANLRPTDLLGIATLRARLRQLAAEPEMALAAGNALSNLDQWAAEHAGSYAVGVGRRLAGRIEETTRLFADLLARVRRADRSEETAATRARQAALGRTIRWIAIGQILAIVVLVVLGAFDVMSWWWVAGLVVLVVLGGLGAMFGVFMRRQQALFQEINELSVLDQEMATVRANLRTVLRDHRRLTVAYRQYLAWGDALGAFLAAPLGTAAGSAVQPVGRVDGLPWSVRVGSLATTPDVLEDAAVGLRDVVFTAGWLTAPWDRLVAEAGYRLGPDGRDLRADPASLYALTATADDGVLARWAELVAVHGPGTSGGDLWWAGVIDVLDAGRAPATDVLTATVNTENGVESREQFVAGIDASAGIGHYLDIALLTPGARARSAQAVELHTPLVLRTGLSSTLSLVQVTSALTPEDLVLTGERRQSAMPLDPQTPTF